MNELEARVRCLELAASLNKASGNYSADGVVKEAIVLYNFTQASAEVATPSSTTDKPSKGSKAKQPDIMS